MPLQHLHGHILHTGLVATYLFTKTVFLVVDVQAVVSAAFESGMFISYMAIVTASVFGANGGSTPHGLSTFDRLEQDVLMPPLALQTQGSKLSVLRCERALADAVRTLNSHELVSGVVGREEMPEMLANGPSAQKSPEEEMMRRFAGF